MASSVAGGQTRCSATGCEPACADGSRRKFWLNVGRTAMYSEYSSSPTRPPAAEDFAAYTASWYLFSESRQLKDKPFSQRILGRQLVGYRAASGQVTVMDARCAHLG